MLISVVTSSELLHGFHRASPEVQRARRSVFLKCILKHSPILEIGLDIARIHAGFWADLRTSAQMIGAHDGWIAASCLAGGHTLVTRNLKEFQSVPDPKVEVRS